MSSPGALDGTTVLDLSTVGPGPRCTRILADYGAKVIKIGAAKAGVQIEPAKWAYGGGRGWTHTRLDLKSEDGKAAFFALAKDADVVVESFRPGVVDRLGIGFDDVRNYDGSWTEWGSAVRVPIVSGSEPGEVPGR